MAHYSGGLELFRKATQQEKDMEAAHKTLRTASAENQKRLRKVLKTLGASMQDGWMSSGVDDSVALTLDLDGWDKSITAEVPKLAPAYQSEKELYAKWKSALGALRQLTPMPDAVRKDTIPKYEKIERTRDIYYQQQDALVPKTVDWYTTLSEQWKQHSKADNRPTPATPPAAATGGDERRRTRRSPSSGRRSGSRNARSSSRGRSSARRRSSGRRRQMYYIRT